jgi:hypothetical protein
MPFGNDLLPPSAAGVEQPYELRSETNASADCWIKLVSRAREWLYLAGIGFTGWRGIPVTREALRGTAASGCEIRILTMDAKNPAFAYMLNADVAAASIADRRQALMKPEPGLKVHSETLQNRMFGLLRRECYFSKSLFSDEQAFISHTSFAPIRDTALVLISTNAVRCLVPFCVSLRSCAGSKFVEMRS